MFCDDDVEYDDVFVFFFDDEEEENKKSHSALLRRTALPMLLRMMIDASVLLPSVAEDCVLLNSCPICFNNKQQRKKIRKKNGVAYKR